MMHQRSVFSAVNTALEGIQKYFTSRTASRRSAAHRSAGRFANVSLPEFLEPRLLLTINNSLAQWFDLGPGTSYALPAARPAVQPPNPRTAPYGGAIESAAADPNNPNVLYVGTVNGGIWKTDNATYSTIDGIDNDNDQFIDEFDEVPTWRPLTDFIATPANQFGVVPTLAIQEVAVSPVNSNVIYAGTGSRSSFLDDGGLPVGVYKSTDGGATWTIPTAPSMAPFVFSTSTGIYRQRVNHVVPTTLNGGNVILASTDKVFTNDGQPAQDQQAVNRQGIYRSTDGGATWTGVLVGASPATDLIADPADPNRFYAGFSGFIFLTTDGGVNWTLVGSAQNIRWTSLAQEREAAGTPRSLGNATRIELSIHNSIGNNVIYAGIVTASGGETGPGMERVFYSVNQGTTWQELPPPQTTQIGVVDKTRGAWPLHNGQGDTHFSMVASRTDPNIVFFGGAASVTQSVFANAVTGRHLSANRATGVWEQMDVNAITRSGAHADSRAMVYDAVGIILEVTDGGIYRIRNAENAQTRVWEPLNSGIRSMEVLSVAWDSLSDKMTAGTQDNGTPMQVGNGIIWEDVSTADGSRTRVDNLSFTDRSLRYVSAQFLFGFRRMTFDSQNRLLEEPPVQLLVANGAARTPLNVLDQVSFFTIFELNKLNPARMLLSTDGTKAAAPNRGAVNQGNLYESLDRGDTLTSIGQNIGYVKSIAYGGIQDGTPQLDVAWVGTQYFFQNGPAGLLWLRPPGAQLQQVTSYRGGVPRDIVVDPDDWRRAWIVDDAGKVWQTGNVSGNVSAITFTDVTSNLGAGGLGETDLNTIEIFAGTTAPGDEVLLVGGRTGVFAKELGGLISLWQPYGTGLPRVEVRELEYNRTDDVLLAGTLGRSIWGFGGASRSFGQSPPVIDLNGTAEGTDFTATFDPTTFDPVNAPVYLSDLNMTVSDADSATLTGASVYIRNRPDGIAETLSVGLPQGSPITANFNSTLGLLTLTGIATVAQYREALFNVSYSNVAQAPTLTPRSITFVATDGTSFSSVATATVNIQRRLGTPFFDLNLSGGSDFVSIFMENQQPEPMFPASLTFVDEDSATLQSVTVFIEDQNGSVPTDAESLSADNSGTAIAVNYEPENATLFLTGTDTIENYQTVLKTLSYNNTLDIGAGSVRTIGIVANDGTQSGPPVFTSIQLVPVNDAPVLKTDVSYKLHDLFQHQLDGYGTTAAELLFGADDQPVFDP
ncbi:MAG: hypothetical protein KDA89_19760, partial [Planctomycetaceae bacterium]|nr:hypothetical protein [Planctomycetaceae bacterium]